MNEESVERLLRDRGRALDGGVLPELEETKLRARLAAEAAAQTRAPWTRRSTLLAAAAVLLLLAGSYLLRSRGAPAVLEQGAVDLDPVGAAPGRGVGMIVPDRAGPRSPSIFEVG